MEVMSSAARRAVHADLATTLSLLSDHELAGLLASGTPAGVGIGGRYLLVEVDGSRVFVKRMPLTDVELLPENARSTANLFELPAFCHYGTGRSPGFGAWRELAVHTMTTNWVLSDRFTGFPLMHHWRVLPDAVQPLPEALCKHYAGKPRLTSRPQTSPASRHPARSTRAARRLRRRPPRFFRLHSRRPTP